MSSELFTRGPHDITFSERLRSERVFGNAMAAAACAGGLALASVIAPALAWVPAAALPVLVIARELSDQNRRIRRLWRDARTTVAGTGSHVVRGIARARDTRLHAPYSQRECLGYYAQFTGTHFGPEGNVRETRHAAEDHVRLADLVVEVGDAKILALAEHTHLICDWRSGEGARLRPTGTGHDAEVDVFVPMTKELVRRARHQEHLLRAGDEVVLAARLEPIDADPYRDASGATHRALPGALLALRPPELAREATFDRAALADRPRVETRPYQRSR